MALYKVPSKQGDCFRKQSISTMLDIRSPREVPSPYREYLAGRYFFGCPQMSILKRATAVELGYFFRLIGKISEGDTKSITAHRTITPAVIISTVIVGKVAMSQPMTRTPTTAKTS